MSICCEELAALFNTVFEASEQTILVDTDDEPHYLPRDNDRLLYCIFYTKDSYTSLMHEVAHWCRAGFARRQLPDYGYWYQASNRSPEAQQLYVQSESKTQALEWIFCVAAGLPVQIIPENQPYSFEPSLEFRRSIYEAALHYLQRGLSDRSERFRQALLAHYQKHIVFNESLFLFEDLK